MQNKINMETVICQSEKGFFFDEFPVAADSYIINSCRESIQVKIVILFHKSAANDRPSTWISTFLWRRVLFFGS